MTWREMWIGGEHLGVYMSHDSKWKSVDDDSGTERMRVPGGWLYARRVTSGGQELSITSVAMTFVPDVPEPELKKKVVIKRR